MAYVLEELVVKRFQERCRVYNIMESTFVSIKYSVQVPRTHVVGETWQGTHKPGFGTILGSVFSYLSVLCMGGHM